MLRDMNQYVYKFGDFSGETPINEMASELTKLGVPKKLMQFIHNLTGELKKTYDPDPQLNPMTGRKDRKFHTRKEPFKAKGGWWPERQDDPVAHDATVSGMKTGRDRIFDYLTNQIDSRKDSKLRLILVNPNIDQVHYITRKTGKMSKEQLAAAGIEDTDAAREQGISQKRGLYIRVVTIDGDSGEPIAAWEGTIGQMADDMDDDSVLYILEEEDRVKASREKRKSIKEVTDDQFIKYFLDNYEKILDTYGKTNSEKLSKLAMEKLSGLTLADIATVLKQGREDSEIEAAFSTWSDRPDAKVQKKFREILDIKKALDEDLIDKGQLETKLHSFKELLFEKGKYEPESEGGNEASLTDAVEKHTMPVLASMFLQFVSLGRVLKPFYTDDPIAQMGLEDLF